MEWIWFKKRYGNIKFGAIAELPSMEIVPTHTPFRNCFPTSSLTQCVTKLLHLCSSGGGKWCLSIVAIYIFLILSELWVFQGHCIFFFNWDYLHFLCSYLNWAIELFPPSSLYWLLLKNLFLFGILNAACERLLEFCCETGAFSKKSETCFSTPLAKYWLSDNKFY